MLKPSYTLPSTAEPANIPAMFTRQANQKPLAKKWIYIALAGVSVATIPCYCAGIAAIRNAPGTTPEATTAAADTFTPQPESTTAMPTAAESVTPSTASVTPTPTGTRYIPPSPTSSFTPSPSPTYTETVKPTLTFTIEPTVISPTTAVPVPTETVDAPPPGD